MREAPLHDKLMQDTTYFARYLERLQRFLEGAGGEAKLLAHVDEARSVLGDRVSDETVDSLRQAISQRVAGITAAIPSTTVCATVATQTP